MVYANERKEDEKKKFRVDHNIMFGVSRFYAINSVS
jgi:hypothetical protein